MADKLGLDGEVHELKLGNSFEGKMAFHSVRYDFKPASVDITKMASVEIKERNSVVMTVPHVQGSGTNQTVFRGNKRPCQKECVLVIDHDTGEFTLEKLSSTIQLKKTREEGSSRAAAQMARPLTPSELSKTKDAKTEKKKKKKTATSSSSIQPKPASSQRKPAPPPTAASVPQTDAVGVMSDSDSEALSSASDSDNEKSNQKDAAGSGISTQPSQKKSATHEQHHRYASMLSEDLRLSDSGSDSD